ncbi:MAG: DUF5596 domain-containing protein [Clostridia bacterium]|nr:DUF5596 domain-containing protein [Clostridia bacterium]
MTVWELCEKIELQDEIAAKVSCFLKDFDLAPVERLICELGQPEASPDAYRALSEQLGEDPDGTKILSCYLLAAANTYASYQSMGISDDIYFDTMKCFPRFIGETLERKGMLAFDRAHWSYRHLNMTILRIGALEYERKLRKEEKVIAIHIPSDASFDPTSLDASLSAARNLIKEKFPDCGSDPITCESWLLSESLREVLKESSNILKFQARFEMKEQYPDTNAPIPFIFHTSNCDDLAALPENTSLQRNLKAWMLAGKYIGVGFGVLKE